MGDRLGELKTKYQSVLTVIAQQGVQLKNVHIENNKLLIRGEAPSEDAKNRVWDQIKLIDSSYGDLTADISVRQGTATATHAMAPAEEKRMAPASTYTVQPGDTLSAISKHFYGDPNMYMKIFQANTDQLKDPDKIQSGQKLIIPAA